MRRDRDTNINAEPNGAQLNGAQPNGAQPGGPYPGDPQPGGREEFTALEWQAFCYLTDELAASERAGFEALLPESEDACLALARMTRLSLQVASVGSLAGSVLVPRAEASFPVTLVRPVQAPASRPAAWIVSAALATCLAVAVFAELQMPPQPMHGIHSAGSSLTTDKSAEPGLHGPALDELIGRWSDARVIAEVRDDDGEERDVHRSPATRFDAALPFTPAEDTDPDSAVYVPSWMLAAASLSLDEAGEPEEEIWEN